MRSLREISVNLYRRTPRLPVCRLNKGRCWARPPLSALFCCAVGSAGLSFVCMDCGGKILISETKTYFGAIKNVSAVVQGHLSKGAETRWAYRDVATPIFLE